MRQPLGPALSEYGAHPLMPEGHIFDVDDKLVITPWGDVLPPVEFSGDLLQTVTQIAETPRLNDDTALIIFARYIIPKISFDDERGCWKLYLAAETDSKGRARYPCVTIKALGYKNQLAHRASLEVFMGIDLPPNEARNLHVDHRCRQHACCNPYHLEVVSHTENVRRGNLARRRATAPDLFMILPEETATFGSIALNGATNNG